MTESAVQFKFDSEEDLKNDLISLYVDEHMEGLNEFQRLTHDVRGGRFIEDNFIVTGDLKGAGNQIQGVSPRDFNNPAGRSDMNTIFKLLKNPDAEFRSYMTKRPNGNLWIFRTMSKKSAIYIDQNFKALLAKAREVAPLIAAGDAQASLILHDEKWFSEPNLEYALNGHFGDLFQALTYNDAVDGGDKVMVGFKIKTGAELVMYSPLVMVIAGSHVDVAGYNIVQAMLKKFDRVNAGSGSDGIVKGYLSIKHELKGDFSFGIAKDPASIVLFCLLVSDFQIYGNLY